MARPSRTLAAIAPLLLVVVAAGCHRAAKRAAARGATLAESPVAAAPSGTIVGSCVQRVRGKMTSCKEYRHDPTSGLGRVQSADAARSLYARTCTVGNPMLAQGFIASEWAENKGCPRTGTLGRCDQSDGTTVTYDVSEAHADLAAGGRVCKQLHGTWRRAAGTKIVDDAVPGAAASN